MPRHLAAGRAFFANKLLVLDAMVVVFACWLENMNNIGAVAVLLYILLTLRVMRVLHGIFTAFERIEMEVPPPLPPPPIRPPLCPGQIGLALAL